ncbi:MAG: methyltransferase domain-containing protein [Pseudomonadota bacterium]
MAEAYSDVVQTARDYYNSEDADNFYFHIWGGEDIHIGLYESPTEAIHVASRRTVETMADLLPALSPGSRVLDLGSGYGGAARYIAKRFGCQVTALNLSEKENERNRAMCVEAGLDQQVDVLDGSFEDIPLPDASVDVVWSQDAILHSGRRAPVVEEAARVLKPGGRFVFTDPMESGQCGREDLEPVLARIHLETLGSFAFYEETCRAVGLTSLEQRDLTPQLITHYSRVAEELTAQREALNGKVSDGYIDRMLTGLNNWVVAGQKGCLAWGIMHFQKQSG